MSGISGSQAALMPARANVARAGAYRAGYFAQTSAGVWATNVVTQIHGVDVSAYVSRLDRPMLISTVINDQPDTAVFSLKSGAPILPRAGHLVVIAFGDVGNPEFSGQILRAKRRYMRGITAPFIDVECIDYSRLFDRRVVTAHWSNTSATQIAIDIVEQWTSGFTYAGVARNLPTIDDFSATNETGTSLLRRLANLIDGAFRFNGRDVHLFGVAGDQSPTAGTNPLPLTVSPVLKSFKGDQFTFEEDVSQVRTRSIVEGKSTTCPVSTPSGDESLVIDTPASVDYLIVAGGASGGSGVFGGGAGGGGGVRSGSKTVSAGSFAVTVGTGGAAVGANTSGNNGTDSSVTGFDTATGGGAGAGTASASGSPGGCGGGGNGPATANGSGSGNPGGTGSQGGTGGAGAGNGNFDGDMGAGGGGAAPADGQGAQTAGPGSATGGNGGDGFLSSITGAPTYYAGGGRGSARFASGTRGLGATSYGGGGDGSSGGTSTAGQPGIVVISYAVGALSATGGTITTVGGRTIHTFTSNDTFVVSTITLTAPAPIVTDLPIDDASKIDPSPGFVRIGTQILPYLSIAGPSVDFGANLPGSSLSSDISAGDISIPLISTTPFAGSPGWAKVGDQIIRYASIAGASLAGIPALGFGSLTSGVKAGTTVTWLNSIVLSVSGVTFSPSLSAGETVIQRVIVDDLTAQATVAALEGGDGVHEQPVSDGRLSLTGATNRANAELSDFSAPITPIVWDTEDLNARPGRQQQVVIDDINVTLVITKADIAFPTPNGLPRRQCEASTVHMAALLDAVVTNTN